MTVQMTRVNAAIRALQNDLEAGTSDATENFWNSITTTPLIEPFSNDNDHRLVTFLWKGTDTTTHVMVISDVTGGTQFPVAAMQHVPQTDVWYLSLKVRRDVRTTYAFSPNSDLINVRTSDEWFAFWASLQPEFFQPDPLNPFQTAQGDSLLQMPDAPPELWLEIEPGVPQGEITHERFSSVILNNERDLWIYSPPGFTREGAPYRWIVFFDGGEYLDNAATTLLDNLLAAGKIAPTVAIFVNSTGRDARQHELSGNDDFNRFLLDELLPDLRTRFNLTSNPAHSTAAGMSIGGVAATYAAFCHPEVFGSVIAQSGAYSIAHLNIFPGISPKTGSKSNYGWLMRQFVEAERKTIRFHLDVGILDTFSPVDPTCCPLQAVRHMRDVLEARGYLVDYTEFAGGHDFTGWRGTLPDALLALGQG